MNQQDFSQGNNQNILPSSTLAIVSLIAGIAGFFFIPVLGSVLALITGYMARRDTRAVPPLASGDGMATAGIVMGWIQVGLTVLGICIGIIFFALSIGFIASSGAS